MFDLASARQILAEWGTHPHHLYLLRASSVQLEHFDPGEDSTTIQEYVGPTQADAIQAAAAALDRGWPNEVAEDLSALSTSELLSRLSLACEVGQCGVAWAIADEMSRPHRAGTCADLATDAACWPAMRRYTVRQLQGLQDRIDEYNRQAGTGK